MDKNIRAFNLRKFIDEVEFPEKTDHPSETERAIVPNESTADEKNDGRIAQPAELEREKVETWLKEFLPKLKRTTSRSQKCRLLESIERNYFQNDEYAARWQFVKFEKEDFAKIFDDNEKELEEFKLTNFQKTILKNEPSLLCNAIKRWEIKEESGDWQLAEDMKKILISKGGEAIVLAENFGDFETAVRVQIFDPFLFTDDFGVEEIFFEIYVSKDFEPAKDKQSENDYQIPFHKNVIRNYVNIELFHEKDEEDCLGWITIMEKGEENLRSLLKEERVDLEERKAIAEGILDGIDYLWENCGIGHSDRKLENLLLVGGVAKLIDFGLVDETTGREGYRKMGYTRKGSKYRMGAALAAGTPGFTFHGQITNGDGYLVDNLFYFLICDWKTAWTLLYMPIDEERWKEIDEIVKGCGAILSNFGSYNWREFFSTVTKIISLDNASKLFCLDNSNLTQSCKMSSLKHSATKCIQQEMQNLTKNVFNQKNTELCVPISVTALLRHAIKHDLQFDDEINQYTFEKILSTITMIIFPRSMAGLNLNPNEKEKEFQQNEIEILLQRICKETYLIVTGWEIIRRLARDEVYRLVESICEYKEVTLNERFSFTRPATVTGAYLFPSGEIIFHQMTLDRVENDEYVLQNTDFKHHSPVLRIPLKNPYYENLDFVRFYFDDLTRTAELEEDGMKMKLVNEDPTIDNMEVNTWYLLPTAFTLQLKKL